MSSDNPFNFPEFSNCNEFRISTLYPDSGGYIFLNKNLFNNLPNTKFTKLILKESTKGTPIIKFGSGNPKVMLVAGIHGNELPPQVAAIRLSNYLINNPFKGTVYMIPFAAPESSMYNLRNYRNTDLNRTAMDENSIGNTIIKKAKKSNIKAIGDFHSSSVNSNPGKYAVFSSLSPLPESHLIALFISQNSHCYDLNYKSAGVIFNGALEDESNLNNIPSVTCEVVSNFKQVDSGSVEKSFNQMFSFLKYFEIVN